MTKRYARLVDADHVTANSELPPHAAWLSLSFNATSKVSRAHPPRAWHYASQV